jgi:hypothetical protein
VEQLKEAGAQVVEEFQDIPRVTLQVLNSFN